MSPSQGEPGFTEEKLDTMAGLVLIGGSALSFIVMGVGLVASAAGRLPRQSIAQPPQDVLAGTVQLGPLSWVNLGILVLMATPVLRVIIAIVGFALQHRWRFVGVSTLVFGLLMLSFYVASR